METRTPGEIKAWLRAQAWYGRYEEHTRKHHGSRLAEKYLEGRCGKYTIAGAFVFSQQPEGFNFWWDEEMHFMQWYKNGKTF